ncbi:uncharacterized protein LOC141730959 [Zonotrichia albicollis]|uniref:uncharacterized protein LOC141730959 n=1 Tax=Zonotrichia albicollis TaxID=44394 RepID=UPI003D80B5AC
MSKLEFTAISLKRHGVSPGERRVGGSAAPPARRGRKRPPPARPSRRLKAPRRSHESRSFGHLRNAAGPPPLLFLPFPEDELVSETPNSLSALGQASVRRRRFLPQVLPAPPPPSLPAGGTRRCPSPAAGQRSPAPPPTGELLPPPGSPRFSTWPRERGRSPGGEGLRKESFSLTPRSAPTQADPQPPGTRPDSAAHPVQPAPAAACPIRRTAAVIHPAPGDGLRDRARRGGAAAILGGKE